MNFNRTEEARRNRMSAMVDDEAADAAAAPKAADRFEGRKQLREACAIRRDRIVPDPDQPRREFDAGALGRLADSLKARGQLQPIRVRWDEGGGVYVVVVGERRWRAAGMAGMETVSCVVVGGEPTAAEVLEDQLVENCLREDLKPVEAARAFRALMGALGLTQEQLADKLRISQPTVSQALSMLVLPPEVQDQVDAGDIPPSVAFQLAKAAPEVQSALADRVVAEKLGRAETADLVRRASGRKPKGGGAAKAKAKKATRRAFRTAAGPRVTVELGRGLTDDLVRAAVAEVLAVLDAAVDRRGAA